MKFYNGEFYYRYIPILVKVGQQLWALYMKTYLRFLARKRLRGETPATLVAMVTCGILKAVQRRGRALWDDAVTQTDTPPTQTSLVPLAKITVWPTPRDCYATHTFRNLFLSLFLPYFIFVLPLSSFFFRSWCLELTGTIHTSKYRPTSCVSHLCFYK